METFLRSSSVIYWHCPYIRSQAELLGRDRSGVDEVVRTCFEWVRDKIGRSGDKRLPGGACSPSQVMATGDGRCFARIHLLAASPRFHEIPSGFCYQRLCFDAPGGAHTLHGLNAVYLPDHGWHRVDPRGNKDGVDAQFDPPQEKLAWLIRNDGEIDGGWLESKVSFERALSSLLDPITLHKFFTRLSKAMKAAE